MDLYGYPQVIEDKCKEAGRASALQEAHAMAARAAAMAAAATATGEAATAAAAASDDMVP